MSNFFYSFQPSDWTSLLLSIISLALTVITLVIANNIPNALSKYRFEQEFILQFDNMIASIGIAKRTMSSYDDFVRCFNIVDSFLMYHKEFFDYKTKKKIDSLHERYITLSKEKFEDHKSQFIKLLDDYHSILNYARIKIGGRTNEKK